MVCITFSCNAMETQRQQIINAEPTETLANRDSLRNNQRHAET